MNWLTFLRLALRYGPAVVKMASEVVKLAEESHKDSSGNRKLSFATNKLSDLVSKKKGKALSVTALRILIHEILYALEKQRVTEK